MTSRSMGVMIFSGVACVFCLVALMGAKGSNLTATFVVSLIILMFYAKKQGLRQHDSLLSEQASH